MLQRCPGLVLVCLLCTGCLLPPLPVLAPDQPPPSATRSAPSSPPSRPPVRETITVAYGETGTVADGLALTFQDVLEDSRCPADIMCAWSGWVRIQLLVQPANEAATTVVITSFTDSKGNTETPTGNQEAQPFAKVGTYLIELKQVTPYPAKHDEPIPLETYQIVIQVHQQQVQPVPTVEPTVALTATVTGSAICPEAPQLPLLCYSNRAITEYAAGVRDEPPLLLTAPVASCQLPEQAAGDARCAANFGEGWEMAESARVAETATWYQLIPAGTGYWVWDEENNELAAQE